MTARSAMAAQPKKTPWRDNIEALTVAIIMAVVLKYFIIEAYKIPTGSMQPTLMGHQETNIHDRILVDKLSYTFRDPKRWEVAVFKYPLDRSKNFVKRICGMPGEYFRIQYGDLWTRPDTESDWTILRRPKGVQKDTWKALDRTRGDEPSAWGAPAEHAALVRTKARQVEMDGAARARFPGRGEIRDNYSHGYPRGMGTVKPRHGSASQHPVGDLRVEGRVRASADCELVSVELEEGTRRYVMEIPGPAAPAEAAPRIHWNDGGERGGEVLGEPYRLPADSAVRFRAQNLDDLLSLEVGGKTRTELEIPLANRLSSCAWLASAGGKTRFDRLQVYRDIYYTEGQKGNAGGKDGVFIPEGHYFMLGDNTQDSSDSRDWSFIHMRWAQGDELGPVMRGNDYRTNQLHSRNPASYGGITWFRDEWGELYTFPGNAARREYEPAPFVPRDLITGRALLVFWPLSFKYKVWRPKWIH